MPAHGMPIRTVLTPIACIWSSAASTSAVDAKYRSEFGDADRRVRLVDGRHLRDVRS